MNAEKIENSFQITSDNKFSESKKGMVSSAFPDATKAGVEMLKKGGNAVGITQSIELVYGGKAAANSLGFLYNCYMSSFEYDNINYPHYLRPNTSPWTSVAPVILFNKNKPWMTLGTPGSDRIPTTTAQFISSIVDLGLNPNDAMNRPRIHCSVDGTVTVEGERFDASVISHLAELGYNIDFKEPYSYYHGAIHAVIKKQGSKGFQGIAEIRRDGKSIGMD